MLRAAEPALLPWSPDQSIHNANDLALDHLLRGCILDFEHKDFFDIKKKLPSRITTGDSFAIWEAPPGTKLQDLKRLDGIASQ